MTAAMPAPPAPSRAHLLMRHGRSWLLGHYLGLVPELPLIAVRAITDYWSREKLTDAIITIESEEAPADVAHDVRQ